MISLWGTVPYNQIVKQKSTRFQPVVNVILMERILENSCTGRSMQLYLKIDEYLLLAHGIHKFDYAGS